MAFLVSLLDPTSTKYREQFSGLSKLEKNRLEEWLSNETAAHHKRRRLKPNQTPLQLFHQIMSKLLASQQESECNL
jgi:hypothetical protein